MAAAVDAGYLSGYLGISPPVITECLATPTADLVRSLLEAVTNKAREHEELIADKLQVDTELEEAIRSTETRSQALKAQSEKASKELEELRQRLAAEEIARTQLESELENLKTTSSTSSSEVESLRSRIASLEASNRDTLAVVASKAAANDSLAQDLQKQHQKTIELSQQVSSLQQQLQDASSAVSSAKFREQNMQQEVDQAKRNNDWLDNELKTKSAEALKFRKEKGARIAELQRQNEEATANVDALKRTETALRARLEEVQSKAEESMQKVQQLQEAAARSEEGFKQELDSARRLADLQTQQAETHRNRLHDVELLLEKARDDLAAEAARHQQNVEADSQERDRLENRIAELEAEVDRLEASATATYPASMPGTPRQGLNGSTFRAGSPGMFGTPGPVSMRKSTITATQAVEELYKVKGQLVTERRRSERLQQEMEEMMQGLEAKRPEIEEMQAEYERLQREIVEMSKFVDVTGKERDKAQKEARKATAEEKKAKAQVNILGQQLRDLGAQVKMLLLDISARERGLESLTGPELLQMERLARGEISEDAFEGMSDTDQFISQHLVIFRSVSELQQKNQDLLRITRELGEKMESEEALAEKNKALEDHQKVQELEKRVEQYNDEIKSLVARSESYIKERDMFRRMLQHRGQIPVQSDLESMFGQSVNGEALMHSIETPNAKDNANYAQLLRELQAHFDQYREEQSVDRRTMKEQADRLATEKATLHSEIAKVNSQLTLAGERYEMLQANYNMLRNENIELQKRSQTLSENAAKQDLRTQQVAEDLIEAKSLVESMRNEIANLKAEKKLWTEIQARLNSDNENLINERSRLNALIANQQSLQNERELSESETRRRLQTQVETLESELSATKRKLNDEAEDHKKTQLRKEYDAQQSQKRIDELAGTLSTIREELVAVKTTKDHLQQRVEELTIELKNAEERVEVLQPKPTPRPGTQAAADADAESMSREQELGLEVSDLKRDLDLAKSELENVKSQVEQYKSISQAAEEDLQKFQEAHEEYEKEMEKIIVDKDSQIRQLQSRVDDLSAELSAANNELNSLRNEQSESARKLSEEKTALEAEIARLKDEDERHATAAMYHQQDLRAQAEIATKAQQDYEHELVRHAEAAKLLQEMRENYNKLRSETTNLKAEAESAKVTLSQSQASWEERRAQFDNELQELRARKDDISAQNTLLLKQLEDVNAQVTALKQSRVASTTTENGDVTNGDESFENVDAEAEGLRQLVTYLRRDKEIVDVQCELAQQEAKRLKQQLDYVQSQLDETRLKLEQERSAQSDGSRNNMAHKDLMEKLNELNLFRESSITLRNEARQAQEKLAEKTKAVEELMATIEPLKNRVQELENAKELQDGEIKLLQEDRDRWQKRNQEILSKYDRIDPAEMEQLKEMLATLQTEKDALVADQQPLQEKVQTLETEKTNWGVSRQKLIEQAKERSRVLTKEKNERTAERDAAITAKQQLEEELTDVKQELDSSIAEKQALQENLESIKTELHESKRQLQNLHTTSSDEPANSEPASATAQNGDVNQQLQALRLELEAALKERDETSAIVAQLEAEKAAQPTGDAAMTDGPEDGELSDTQAVAEQPVSSDAEKKAIEQRAVAAEARVKELEVRVKEREDRVSELEARVKELEARIKDMEDTNETVIKQRSEKMKQILNKKLVESREAAKAALEAEFAEKLQTEKQAWLTEHATSNSTVTETAAVVEKPKEESVAASNPPATPATPAKTQPGLPANVDLANLGDEQTRALLMSNQTVKSILASNIRKKVEEEAKKLREEHDKKSTAELDQLRQDLEKEKEELLKKADEAKAQALNMESKRVSVKLNMADNRAKLATAKLGVVEKAATDTPQRPVVEVWQEVKTFKLPPAAAAATAATPAPNAPGSVSAITAGTSTIPKPQGAPAVSGIRPPSVSVPAATAVAGAAGQQSRPSTPAQPQTAGPTQTTGGTSPNAVQQAAPAHANQPANGSALPVPSQIPQAPGGAPRTGIPRGGSNIARGRGGTYQAPRGGGQSGIGRGRGGGNQRGGMNPAAHNFHPGAGNKRPHDESGGPQGGQGQKRMRGGAQGGN